MSRKRRLTSIVFFSLLSSSALAATQPTSIPPSMPTNPGMTTSGSSDNSMSGAQGTQQLENDALEATKSEFDQYKSNLPDWFQRIDYAVWMQDYVKPSWYIRTIQPIHRWKNNIFFTQDQVSYQQNRTTSNIGLGYRRLVDDKKLILGINSFYDREWHYQQDRLGAGLEAIGQYITLRTNFYQALSSQSATNTVAGVTTYEKALDGYDIGAELPVPFLQWARFTYTRYYWWRAGLPNVRGNTFEFDLYPTSNIEADLGVTKDNTMNTSYFLNLSWHFGRPARIEYAASTQPATKHAFVARDLTKHMLDYVKRENYVIVANTQSGSGGVTIQRGN